MPNVDSNPTLTEQLKDAKIIVSDPQSGLMLAWFGGESMGIHGYTATGEEVAYWTMGGCAADKATEAEVRGSIYSHINDQYFPG